MYPFVPQSSAKIFFFYDNISSLISFPSPNILNSTFLVYYWIESLEEDKAVKIHLQQQFSLLNSQVSLRVTVRVLVKYTL